VRTALTPGAARGLPFDTSGGWTLPALVYAFWEPFVAWGIILGMLWRFRFRSRSDGARTGARDKWPGCAYAAYIVHSPVVVGLGLLLGHAALPNSLRFVIAGAAGIVLSFVLGRLLLLIPGARRVL
jgi:hypothetical protein